MSMIKKIATAGAVAVMGLGLGAASASATNATDISGGAYSGSGSAQHTFIVDGSYTIACDASFSGNTENGANAVQTIFTPAFSNCDFFGFPADVTISGGWTLNVGTLLSASPEVYGGSIVIPNTSSIQIDVPLVGCEVYISTPQTFTSGVTGTDTNAGVDIDGDVTGISYTTNGSCPFGNGSTGEYHTNGPVSISNGTSGAGGVNVS